MGQGIGEGDTFHNICIYQFIITLRATCKKYLHVANVDSMVKRVSEREDETRDETKE